jgi:hypothetical protein
LEYAAAGPGRRKRRLITVPEREVRPRLAKEISKWATKKFLLEGKREQPSPAISYGPLNFESCSTIQNGVEVKPSSVPSLGNGLFASKTFEINDIVTEYGGEVIMKADVGSRKPGYVMDLGPRSACVP